MMWVMYLPGLIHGDEGGDHTLPQRVLVMPQSVCLHRWVWGYKELNTGFDCQMEIYIFYFKKVIMLWPVTRTHTQCLYWWNITAAQTNDLHRLLIYCCNNKWPSVVNTQMEGTNAEEHISTFNTAAIKMTIAKNNDSERSEEVVNPWPRRRVASMGTLVI